MDWLYELIYDHLWSPVSVCGKRHPSCPYALFEFKWLKEETMAVLFSLWIWNILRSAFFFGTCCAVTTTPRLISLQVPHQFNCARVRLPRVERRLVTGRQEESNELEGRSCKLILDRLIRQYPRLCSVIDVAADENTTWCHASGLRTSPLCFECQELSSSGSGQGWWAECEEISQRLVLGGVSYLSEVYKNFLWLT